ncbi:hypothetical protein IHE55_06290 [Streptomyces pactum]|uniref:DUF2530 domain-containing protein n=1 Tax=Streptomyces pactum TaxID=68249 RepID=A0ABS0NGW0_9ACTN|nr:hypothetical protein [Streptomyces pactum]MBH5334433.1 hypothetical protein [Streptomyces pactum]
MAGRDGGPAGARDDDAAFAEIVAAYGAEPADPPGVKPWPDAEDVAGEAPAASAARTAHRDTDGADGAGGPGGPGGEDAGETAGPAAPDRPLGGFIVYAPGVGPGAGPRDWTPEEPSDDDFEPGDEGHFVPPDPPLPHADTTARFAWIAVIGGPLLLLIVVLLRQEMTWWISTLGVGGFLGGFATLVMRMRPGDDEEDDDPGRGAVV